MTVKIPLPKITVVVVLVWLLFKVAYGEGVAAGPVSGHDLDKHQTIPIPL